MPSLHPAQLRRASLPADARELLSFPPRKQAVVTTCGLLARLFGFWRYPQDMLLEMNNTLFWAYWIYKTHEPIVRPMRGSGLGEYFADHREPPENILPFGFQEQKSVSLSAVGDLIAAHGLDDSGGYLYEEVHELIFDADIAVANFESTLSSSAPVATKVSPEKTPEINVTEAGYKAFIGHGEKTYTIMQLANNHILDCGDAGLSATIKRLEEDGIDFNGINQSEERAHEARITESNGIRIGWVSFTFSVNFRPFPPGRPRAVNFVPFHLQRNPDIRSIEEQIQWCKERDCDLVILGLHWGLEFEFFPHPAQLEWAHHFANLGADLIVSHHPHVIQPVEYYRTERDNNRVVPILYSLGNLVPLISHPASVLSMVARLEIVQGILDGEKVTYTTVAGLYPIALLAGEDNGEERLQLYRLDTLLELPLTPETRRYVEEISSYADVALGPGWRTPASGSGT